MKRPIIGEFFLISGQNQSEIGWFLRNFKRGQSEKIFPSATKLKKPWLPLLSHYNFWHLNFVNQGA